MYDVKSCMYLSLMSLVTTTLILRPTVSKFNIHHDIVDKNRVNGNHGTHKESKMSKCKR